MNALQHGRRIVAGSLCMMVITSAIATEIRPQVTGFRSTERITHLAPGGANAAREIEVSVALFDSHGQPIALPGIPLVVEAYDGDQRNHLPRIGQVSGVSDAAGRATFRLPLGVCQGGGIEGPLRVHRNSNRPEYWDLTYVRNARMFVIAQGQVASVRFVHVCRETYRGARP